MTVEYTGVGKETAISEFEHFMESQPEDAIFRLVISSKRGYLKIQLKKEKSRIKRLLGRARKR
jgi:hypothetical protein